MQVAGHRRPQIIQFTQIDSSLHRTEQPQITQMDADTIARLNRNATVSEVKLVPTMRQRKERDWDDCRGGRPACPSGSLK